jgi:hypothetical protein
VERPPRHPTNGEEPIVRRPVEGEVFAHYGRLYVVSDPDGRTVS